MESMKKKIMYPNESDRVPSATMILMAAVAIKHPSNNPNESQSLSITKTAMPAKIIIQNPSKPRVNLSPKILKLHQVVR